MGQCILSGTTIYSLGTTGHNFCYAFRQIFF